MQDSRFEKACEHTAFLSLNGGTQTFLKDKAISLRLSFANIQNLITAAIDLQMWGEDIKTFWSEEGGLKGLLSQYENLKNSPKSYLGFKSDKIKREFSVQAQEKSGLGFGKCPVASLKTRCCNLLTLDAYEGCGFDCSYCSIQAFYKDGKIAIDKDFAQKLAEIKIDPREIYHIGTGQSSDSLMWGNKDGVLEALIKFARKNPNVILEFKSKSSNIAYLLRADLPPNIICTFSLNPQIVIDAEEHFTASLTERISAARALSEKGVLVGFHFHPMILFDGWREAYLSVAKKLVSMVDHKNVALISMGTLTFTKPVLRLIRVRAAKSKILQMPLTQSGGKYSYPLSQKKEMFAVLYHAFEKWHGKVFFYLCMEDESLWQKVFGYEFADNEAFERAMKKAYMDKIKERM